jgi:hypothetical protein
MKTIISIFMMFLVGYSTMTAQNTPKFQFKTEVIDYGEIEKGSNGVRVFEFTNTGKRP